MDGQSKKTWVISSLIILAAILAYFTFFSSRSADDFSQLQTSSESSVVGAQVLAVLNQLRQLQIDSAFFQSEAYTSLIDFSVQIPPQNVGRPNPFAPIPGLRTTNTR